MFHYLRSRSKTASSCFTKAEAEEVVIFRIFWACYFQRNKAARLLRWSNTIKLSTCLTETKGERRFLWRWLLALKSKRVSQYERKNLWGEVICAFTYVQKSKYGRTNSSKRIVKFREAELPTHVGTDVFVRSDAMN